MTQASTYQLAVTQFSTEFINELSVVQYDRSLIDNTALGVIFTNAKQRIVFPLPVDSFRLFEDDGQLHFVRNGSLEAEVSRGVQLGGAVVNVYEAAEYDPAAMSWPTVPATAAIVIANADYEDLAHVLNGAFSGIPQDEFGVKIGTTDDPNAPRRLSSYLQVYAKLSEQKPFVVLDGDTADYFPVNPAYPTNTDIGPAWFNGYENSAITPENIRRALTNLQSRRNFKGQHLGYAYDPATVELWCAPGQFETAREILEELTMIPGTGALTGTPVQVPINGGGGASQVIFGTQTNTILRKARPRKMVAMREDMWCLVETGGMRTREHALFYIARGGTGTDYQINMRPDQPQNTSVPYIAIREHMPGGPLNLGAIPGSRVGDIGVDWRINKGLYLASPHRIVFNYTGAAS